MLRPAAVSLAPGAVQPGVCAGLREAILGMRIGGTRRVSVPPSEGFGPAAVLAPYAIVPGNAALVYEVELLRVSARGPDEMMKVR